MDHDKIRNMEEFASFCGVSRPTVSKYFHDPSSVRPTIRAKIEEALAASNYRPNVFAINQNRKLTKNIGILVPFISDPFFAEIARRIEKMVIAAGYRPVLLSSHGSRRVENENLEFLRAIKPAGALLAPLGRASDADAILSFCEEVPTVNFDANVAGAGMAFYGHNNVQATSIMIEYLTRTGEPPVFLEMETPPNPNARKRHNAYLETMERLGHTPHIISVPGEGWELEAIGYEGGKAALTEGKLPYRTIFCSNDRLAIGVLAAAYEMGLRVGIDRDCDLRVAGHDNHPFSRFTCPTLTTISHDYNAISQRSVRALLEVIDSGERPSERESILFDGELIMRASA